LNEVKNGSFLEDFDQIFFQLCPAWRKKTKPNIPPKFFILKYFCDLK
jgi:hypothetical protein